MSEDLQLNDLLLLFLNFSLIIVSVFLEHLNFTVEIRILLLEFAQFEGE